MATDVTAEQLAALIQSVQIQGAALQALLKSHSPSAGSSKGNESVTSTLMTHSITFETFDDEKEDFSSYRARLENFFNLRQLTGEDEPVKLAKTRILINSLGSKFYQLLASLTAPAKPTECAYDDLVTKLEKQLTPTTNVHTERHKFLSRVQKTDENVSTYYAALKMMAQKCNWTCPHCEKPIDSVLQAQFIRGLKDVEVRKKVLLESPEDIPKTISAASALEAADKQNREEFTDSTSTVKEVHKINRQTSSRNQYHSNSKKPFKQKGKHNDQRSQKGKKSYLFSTENLKKLGLLNTCLCCGRTDHKTDECRSKNRVICRKCNKRGHISKVCLTNLTENAGTKSSNVKHVDMSSDSEEEYHEYFANQITPEDESKFRIYNIDFDDSVPKVMMKIKIGGNDQIFELDTGSGYSIISKRDYEKLKLKTEIRPCSKSVRFRAYNETLIVPLGCVRIPIQYEQVRSKGLLFIVNEDYTPIMGRSWIHRLKILDLDKLNNYDSGEYQISSVDAYPSLLKNDIGEIPNTVVSLKLKEGAQPVYMKPRPVPFALLPLVNKELDDLEKQGIIEKVDYCPWGSPLVIVPKPNNAGVRICADYKNSVNPNLIDSHYPIPRVPELFAKLKGARYFSIVDLKHAYLHIKLDSESARVAAISTHRGTYLAKRLFYGLKTAPSIFHRILDPILENLEGCVSYFDDILIYGNSKAECEQRLHSCLRKLQSFNIRINKDKCKFLLRKIKYLGHVISEAGLERDSKKVDAILKMQPPENEEKLRSFLGMVQHYHNFIPDAATILHPLNKLLQQGKKFNWDKKCQTAFANIKAELTSDKVLVHYDHRLPLVVETDASPFGIAAILSHRIDGTLKPISYISRSLTAAEKNYSHLDKEATAIFWAVQKFHQFLYGRKFELVTDNKPLQMIFNPAKQLPSITALRLTRYALVLRQYEYSIVHRSADKHKNVDHLSRVPIYSSKYRDDTTMFFEHTVNHIAVYPVVTPKTLQCETEKDKDLKVLLNNLREGKQEDDVYSLHDGVIMRGMRVVIPTALQPAILKELHHTHVGIVKMKAIARSTVYWKGIDADIERLVKSCPDCARVQKDPVKAPIHHWETPQEIWQRIHFDFAGPILNKHLLIVVDALSKWVETKVFNSPPTAETTIRALKEIFARQGLPFQMVTDNATIFTCKEIKKFADDLGIIWTYIAPGHPASNGLAERMVQTFKKKIKASSSQMTSSNFADLIDTITFKYRITPLECGKSPAELHYSRKIRSALSLLKPMPKGSRPQLNDNRLIREFKVGQRVLSRHYRGSQKWITGIIQKRLGKLHYWVKLDNGYEYKRHCDQLKATEVRISSEAVHEPQVTKSATPSQHPYILPMSSSNPTPVIHQEPEIEGKPQPTLRRSQRPKLQPKYLSDYQT